MADTSLTPEDLFDLAIEINILISKFTMHRIDLYQRNQINKTQLELISNYEGRLSNAANQASILASEKIITNINDAKNVLIDTIKDLEIVIEQLNSFSKFLETIVKLLNIFSTITQAIAGGTTALIDALVQELNNIGSRGFENISTRGQINEV